jgi:hypothetical protein
MIPDDDLDGDLGTLDVAWIDENRSAFTGLDGLAEKAGFPALADPRVLTVRFSDGIGDAEDGRFDIKLYRTATTAFTTPTRRNATSDGTTTRKWERRTNTSIRHPTPPPRILRRRAFRPWIRRSSLRSCTSCGVGHTTPAVRS